MSLFTRSRPIEADDADTTDAPRTFSPRRYRYWIKRDQSAGGNLNGECAGVEIARSGALVIHGDHGRIRRLAPGTWLECETTKAGSMNGGDP